MPRKIKTIETKIVELLLNESKTYPELKNWAQKEKIRIEELNKVLDSLNDRDVISINWTELEKNCWGAIITLVKE